MGCGKIQTAMPSQQSIHRTYTNPETRSHSSKSKDEDGLQMLHQATGNPVTSKKNSKQNIKNQGNKKEGAKKKKEKELEA